ncbi:MAG: leucine-rich repeat domain-containing protein [Saprospiraceae bacterium]|nr:leucine-rich repeat domain-containing protein [Saprospiraceae bacterium]
MDTIQSHTEWWHSLEPQWQMAFNQVMLQRGPVTDLPDEAGFAKIFEHKFLRFAGPRAPYPNMNFELTNLSGLAVFEDAEMISATFHQIKSMHEIAHIRGLKSLFLDNNQLVNLEGVEDMAELKELYVQANLLESLKPIEKLTGLTALYCSDNKLINLDGLTEDHSDNLRFFVCLPNEGIKQREIIRVENTLGIKCRGVN